MADGFISQRDVKKLPQYVVEGATRATFGLMPANPAFVPIGKDPQLEDTSGAESVERRSAGNVDREGLDLQRNPQMLNLDWEAVPDDLALLRKFIDKPNGANTPDESLTILDQYDDVSANILYRAFTGCKPQSVTLTKTNNGYITAAATLKYLTRTISAAGPEIGTGSYGVPAVVAPIAQHDSGENWFSYDGAYLPCKGFNITVANAPGNIDSSGSKHDLYYKPVLRSVSGSVDIFKQNEDIQNDALAQTPRAVTVKISAALSLTLTKLVFTPSDPKKSGKASDATIETKSWTADSVAIA